MSYPKRIFIALGDQNEISSLASNDLGREADKKTIDELNRELRDAQEQAKKAEEILTKAVGLFVFVIAVVITAAAITLWLWLNSGDSGPPHLQQPPVQHEEPPNPPSPKPPTQPDWPSSSGCRHGCGPPHYRKYEDFECWRIRSMRGSCFD